MYARVKSSLCLRPFPCTKSVECRTETIILLVFNELSKSLDIVLALFFSTAQCSFFLLSCVTISERVVKETQGLDSVGRIYQTTENDVLS